MEKILKKNSPRTHRAWYESAPFDKTERLLFMTRHAMELELELEMVYDQKKDEEEKNDRNTQKVQKLLEELIGLSLTPPVNTELAIKRLEEAVTEFKKLKKAPDDDEPRRKLKKIILPWDK